MPVPLRALAYVGLETRSLEEWADFGTGVLGAPITRDGDRLLLRIDERVYRFDIRKAGDEGLAWLGWEVGAADELAECEAALEQAGVGVRRGTPEERADRRVVDLLVFEDPAGIRNEISYGQEADFRPLEFTRPLAGYLTGELGMGHAVVGVENYEETLRFYTDVMGFRVSDVFQNFITFLHCNPRHHSLALVETDGPGLRHVMLEVGELDDLGLTLDLALERGILTRTLGRHTNDRAISFYMRTPSGWDIEYGWSGQHVDDEVWSVRQLVGPTSLWGHQHFRGREVVEAEG